RPSAPTPRSRSSKRRRRGPRPDDTLLVESRRPAAGSGWGGRLRTREWRYQKPLPYHLATPQQRSGGRSISRATARRNVDAVAGQGGWRRPRVVHKPVGEAEKVAAAVPASQPLQDLPHCSMWMREKKLLEDACRPQASSL